MKRNIGRTKENFKVPFFEILLDELIIFKVSSNLKALMNHPKQTELINPWEREPINR